jgi:RNA polymerase sigma-70 factor (ECF subfamily)
VGASTGPRSSTTSNSGPALASQPVSKDCRLVQQAIAGDLQVREELFATHAARLYHIAFSVLHNKEDAVQNSLCRAFINLRSFQGRSSFTTWLTRIVIKLVYRLRSTLHPQSKDQSAVGARGIDNRAKSIPV